MNDVIVDHASRYAGAMMIAEVVNYVMALFALQVVVPIRIARHNCPV